MRKDITIEAQPRTLRGKNEARRLRASGSVPAVVYGSGGEAVAVAASPKEADQDPELKRHRTQHHFSI